MSLFIENRVKGILKINSIIIKRTPSTEKRPSFSDHFASTRAHYFSIDEKLQSCIRVKYMFFVVVVAVVVFLCCFFLSPRVPCNEQVQKRLASVRMRGKLWQCYVKLHYEIALGARYGPTFPRTFLKERRSGKIDQNRNFVARVEKSISFIFRSQIAVR